MSERMLGYLLAALAGLLYLVSVATFVAMVRALTVTSTVTAIESAFGTMVIGILLLVLARKAWLAGKSRFKSSD
jgi:hypothetical protein